MSRSTALRLMALLCASMLLVTAVRADCGDYKEGQKWMTGPPDKCAEYSCKDKIVTARLCAQVFVPRKCKLSAAPAGSKFPNCCPTIECP